MGSATLTPMPDIVVPAYRMPAPAPLCIDDPSIPHNVDTRTAEFVNASAWVGGSPNDSLWQIHTTGFDPSNGAATVRWYEIDPYASRVVQTG